MKNLLALSGRSSSRVVSSSGPNGSSTSVSASSSAGTRGGTASSSGSGYASSGSGSSSSSSSSRSSGSSSSSSRASSRTLNCASGTGAFSVAGGSSSVNKVCGGGGASRRANSSNVQTITVANDTPFCFSASLSILFGGSGSLTLEGPNGVVASLTSAGSTQSGGVLPPGTYDLRANATTSTGFVLYSFDLTDSTCN